MRKNIISIILIVLFIPMIIPSTSATQEYNFSITFELPTDSARSFVYGNYMKEALKPLGIDVNIKYIPWTKYIGDLTHLTNPGIDWDLIEVGFSSGPNYADYSSFYASSNFWGSLLYQLGDPNFQAWQLADVGLSQSDIDNLMLSIDSEFNISRRYELQDQLLEMFMTQLLYNIPTTHLLSAYSMPSGFGGLNNELWDVREGVVGSRALGSKWETNPTLRNSNASTLRLSTGDQGMFNLDPYQVFDASQGSQTEWLDQSELLVFDPDLNPHPSTAWNFIVKDLGDMVDHDNDPITPKVGLTQYTFFIQDEIWWPETTDYQGNLVPAEKLDALDYDLTMTFMDTAIQSSTFGLKTYNERDYEGIYDWWVNDTLRPNDTFTVRLLNDKKTVEDLINIASLKAIPAHIFGGQLNYFDSIEGIEKTTLLSPGMPVSPWNTYQWNNWETFAGNSLVGPYEMVNYEFNVYHYFKSRPDYWYPNEWDVETYYSSTDIEINTWDNQFNLNLSKFGGSNYYSQDANYWNYDDIASNHNKPTSQNIEFIEYIIINDPESIRVKFMTGDIDVLIKSAYPVPQQIIIENDSSYVTKHMKTASTGRLIVFDLLNEHLRKFNVRNAIAHAIDSQVLIDFSHGNAVKANSPDFGNQRTNEAWGIPYDLDIARSLMLIEGYSVPAEYSLPNIQVDDSVDFGNAINFNLVTNQFESNDINFVIDPTSIEEEKSVIINYLALFFGITLIAVTLIRKKQ